MAVDGSFTLITFSADGIQPLGDGRDGAVYQLTVMATDGAGNAASLGGGTLAMVRSLHNPPNEADADQWEVVKPGLDALTLGFTYDVSLGFPGLALTLTGSTTPDVTAVWRRLR